MNNVRTISFSISEEAIDNIKKISAECNMPRSRVVDLIFRAASSEDLLKAMSANSKKRD